MRYLIGADEVGTGAWAGPFVVCAFLARTDWLAPNGLDDSKKLMPQERDSLSRILENDVRCFHWIGYGWPDEIDHRGLRIMLIDIFKHVLNLAMAAAHPHQFLAIADGDLPLGSQVESVPKADTEHRAVMAASVIAKVHRDRFMREEIHPAHPEYGFDRHVGYGVPAHIDALKKYGPCAAHRLSYKPIKRIVMERTSR